MLIRAHPDREGAEPVLYLPSASGEGLNPANEPPTPPVAPQWRDVPWRTIVGSVGVVALTVTAVGLIYVASSVVVLILIAGFFAIVLSQPVHALEQRFHFRKGVAIGAVVGTTLVLVAGTVALFVLPVRSQLAAVLTDLPGTVQQGAHGRGPIGQLIVKLHLEKIVQDHQASLTRAAQSLSDSMPSLLKALLGAVLDLATVVVLTCLMLTQSRVLSRTVRQVVPMRHRDHVTAIADDAASAVSGYMIGNLLISLFAGLAAFVVLIVLGVPNAVIIALFVAVADLIPLVGATIGATVAVVAAFLVSTTVGIVVVVFFVLYQQFENSVLQVVIMSRRASVNPLVVLLSVLLGVDLFGMVGALLAIPVAGALTVIVQAIWQHRPLRDDELLIVSDGSSDDGSETSQPISLRRRVRRWSARRHTVRTG